MCKEYAVPDTQNVGLYNDTEYEFWKRCATPGLCTSGQDDTGCAFR